MVYMGPPMTPMFTIFGDYFFGMGSCQQLLVLAFSQLHKLCSFSPASYWAWFYWVCCGWVVNLSAILSLFYSTISSQATAMKCIIFTISLFHVILLDVLQYRFVMYTCIIVHLCQRSTFFHQTIMIPNSYLTQRFPPLPPPQKKNGCSENTSIFKRFNPFAGDSCESFSLVGPALPKFL